MSDDTLKARITEEMKAAMRAKDKPRLGTIRLIQAEIKRIEVDERIEVDDSRLLAILDKMLKQRKDAANQYREAQRSDLEEQELYEVGVIQEFLPAALSDAEIDALIDSAIAKVGASSMADMGKVMGLLKPELQGRADMSQVSQKLKAKLQ